MHRDPQQNACKLFQVGSDHRGYFSAAQALQVGYAYSQHHFHIARGNWIRVDHGIFRLRDCPPGGREDLIHLSLWSHNRQGEPQAVVSHHTAREKFPKAKPRIISDNGPQFVAKSFKEFIRLCGMTHVRTAPNYPQSNGKIERWHKSLKTECIRPGTPLSLGDGLRLVDRYVRCYNDERLHSAIGYVTPKDKLEGREAMIFADRKRKLAEARKKRTLAQRQPDVKALVESQPIGEIAAATCAA